MGDRDSEVPLDLKHALAPDDNERDDGITLSTQGLRDWPPENWHTCPECSERLSLQRYLKARDGTVTAVRYTCSGADNCGRIWVWEREQDEIYFAGEVEVVQVFDHDLSG